MFTKDLIVEMINSTDDCYIAYEDSYSIEAKTWKNISIIFEFNVDGILCSIRT